MTNPGRVFVVLGCLVSALLVGVDGGPVVATAASAHTTHDARRIAAPTHSIVVSGDGAATYPAYDPAVTRYGVTTTAATGGTLTVGATTTDPAGTVLVDGRPAPGGVATVTGLVAGDEVAVWIVDAGGTERHSYVYLPDGFPTLERTTGSLTGGQVMLTLSNQWFERPPDFFETVVDGNGVPSWVHARRGGRSIDLDRQPDGHYTVARVGYPATPSGDTYVELDQRFRPVRTIRTKDLVNTDGHDLVVEPDGTTWLMAYEPNDVTGMTDSVIQRLSPSGRVTFQWSTAGLEGETVTPGNPDYAHLNSLQPVLGEDAVIASFRHFSSVFKIDTSTPTGRVVWKLGGRDSSFTFEDAGGDPDGGPCAQHTARLTPDGDVMVFDNGSGGLYDPLCVDPADPSGPPVARPQTRIATFSLDQAHGVATLVRSYAPPGRYAWFAGSVQPLAGGHTMVGWASAAVDAHHPQVATELDAAGDVVWELANPVDPGPSQKFFSYRAHKAVVPDAMPPRVAVTRPAAGASYAEGAQVRASWTCHDRGGSSLRTCAGTTGNGALLDTRPGTHRVRVRAVDGAGLVTTVTRTYTVRPVSRPHVRVRLGRDRTWSERLAVALRSVGATAVVRVRVRNGGARPDQLGWVVDGTARGFAVVGDRAGRTPVLAPGGSVVTTLRVTRRRAARPGDAVVLRVRVTSLLSGRLDDAAVRVVARRP
ncbi:aryl-sulfate sulfotransferase [Nocardioides rubriscoriae]|uniref:aryl-sulfate sulfotransferase n=1 Tax=Nocardioides rubriscoriae TaxID=642762 RepID=UPI0011DF8EB4|nr:aryl-sulfate sulfotransferase [Nocardioides rubriscoriae]